MIKNSNNNNNNKIDFYQLLGINKNFNESELKRAYYRLSLKYHPDNNEKMSDMFQIVNDAYEILKSPQKKRIYDEYGISAFNGIEIKEDYKKIQHKKVNDFDVSIFDDPNDNSLIKYDESSEDITNDVLNNSYLINGEKKNEKEETKIKKCNIVIDVTLEELYCGVEKEVEIERNVICPECFGQKNFGVCDICLGNGYTYNVTLEKEIPCLLCDGTGKKKIDKNEKCLYCDGKSTIPESKILIAHILPGMKHNERIIFKDEGDQSVNSPPNDLIALINLIPHDKYTCDGNDLVINVKITLKEALCGLRRRIKFLDNSFLSIMTNPGEVITPNSIKIYKNKGLVKRVGSNEKGNLKIKFFVQFPENNWTNMEDIKILEKILSKGNADKIVNEEKILPANINSNNNKDILKEHLLSQPKEILSPSALKPALPLKTSTPPPLAVLRSVSPNNSIDQFNNRTVNDSAAILGRGEKISSNPSDEFFKEKFSQETSKNVRRGDERFERGSQDTARGGYRNEPEKISTTIRALRRGDEGYRNESDKISPVIRALRRGDDGYRGESDKISPAIRALRKGDDGHRNESDKISPAIRNLRKGDDGHRSESDKISPAIRNLRKGDNGYKNESDKISPAIRNLRKGDDNKRTIYSDEENQKLNKPLPSKAIKSPMETDLSEKSIQDIINNINDLIPPPLPPFPNMQKQLMNSQPFAMNDKKMLFNSQSTLLDSDNESNMMFSQESMQKHIQKPKQAPLPPPKQQLPPTPPSPIHQFPLPPPTHPLPMQPISKQPPMQPISKQPPMQPLSMQPPPMQAISMQPQPQPMQAISMSPPPNQTRMSPPPNQPHMQPPHLKPIKTSPLQTSPMQTSPMKISPMQISPMQISPMKIQTMQTHMQPMPTSSMKTSPMQEHMQLPPIPTSSMKTPPMQASSVKTSPVQATSIKTQTMQASTPSSQPPIPKLVQGPIQGKIFNSTAFNRELPNQKPYDLKMNYKKINYNI